MVDNNADDSDSTENGLFNNTRRQFVAGSVALGGIAVGTGLTVPSLAQDADETPPEPIQNEFEDDTDLLNFALTLERLEAEFYRQGLENFDESDFPPSEGASEDLDEETEDSEVGNETEDDAVGNETEDSEVGNETEDGAVGNETEDSEVGNETEDGAVGNETADSEVGNETSDDQVGNETEDDGMGEDTDGTSDGESGADTDQAAGEETEEAEEPYGELQTILAQEEEHVETLETVIEEGGGDVAPEPEVEFGSAVEDPMEFLGTAIQLEDIGVSAYAGAAPFIQNDDLVAPALSIHSVEGRHAAYVRSLMGQTSFPNTFDQARSRSEVLELAGQFVTNIEEFEPEEPAAEDEDEDEDQGTPEISIEEFQNQTEDGEVGNETDGGIGNETDDGVGNETDGNTTGENATDA
ncbi:ferritin-like domain-containing protein [Halovenus amylolytica]|uniref:ferritin-like domain-containing protein n=1 Tax=Halovenus amylolytica TaxID=2500550 RepID=UPI003623C7D3